MSKSVRVLVLSAVAKTIKGASFVGVKNYTNEKGETSNYLIQVGADGRKFKEFNWQALKDKQLQMFVELEKEHSLPILTEAYNVLYERLEKHLSDEETKEKLRKEGDTTIKRSDAQNDAYEYITTGIKKHKETGIIYVFGTVHKRKIVEKAKTPSEKKESADPVIRAQNAIKKYCKFRGENYGTFKIEQGVFNMQGLQI